LRGKGLVRTNAAGFVTMIGTNEDSGADDAGT
jgi:hypothetical protein